MATKSAFKQECETYGLDLEGWKIYYFYSNKSAINDEWGRIYIIKKSLNDDKDLPSLVGMAGFSVKSFCGTTNRIMQNLDKIKSKYNAVWMFCLSEQIRAMQTKACKERDEQNSYDPEIELNEKIGKHVNKLLDITGLTNIHLIGKCGGCGVLLHTFVQDDEKYNALYLGVPASPTDAQLLLTREWTNKKFIFAWDVRDAYPFQWSSPPSPSNKEIEKYRLTMSKLKGTGNTVRLEEFGEGEADEKKYHEIPDELFDLL